MTTAEVAALADQLARRGQQLEPAEQRAQLTLYRLLAEGNPVPTVRLAAQTGQTRSEIQRSLDRWPGVQTHGGEVVAFQGLSLTGTPHRLRVDGRALYTWCAWDTLFLPELLGRSAEVESLCPTTARRIRLHVDASGPHDSTPADVVLSFRRAGLVFVDGVMESFCRFVHFFASAAAAQPWISRHPGTFLITPATGFDIGRRTNAARFGTALPASRNSADDHPGARGRARRRPRRRPGGSPPRGLSGRGLAPPTARADNDPDQTRNDMIDHLTIELLYFDGCPSHEQLLPTVEQLAAQTGAELQLRRVETPEAAEHERFLGSPTVRVNGVDVDRTAAERTDFGLKCRIYRLDEDQSPLPPEMWIRAALERWRAA